MNISLNEKFYNYKLLTSTLFLVVKKKHTHIFITKNIIVIYPFSCGKKEILETHSFLNNWFIYKLENICERCNGKGFIHLSSEKKHNKPSNIFCETCEPCNICSGFGIKDKICFKIIESSGIIPDKIRIKQFLKEKYKNEKKIFLHFFEQKLKKKAFDTVSNIFYKQKKLHKNTFDKMLKLKIKKQKENNKKNIITRGGIKKNWEFDIS